MKRFMFYRLSLCILFLVWVIARSAGAQAQQPAVLVIEGGTLIDGNGGTPVPDALIIIRGNRIETVSRKGQASSPAGAQVLRADGKFIVPGLMDAHVHYSGFLAELFLNYGVTTAMDIAGGGQWQLARREAIARGKIQGPRIFAAGGESLLAPPLPGRVMWGPAGRQDGPWTNVEEARAAVRRAIAAGGADMINIRRGLSLDAFQAAVEEAHRAGKAVVAQPIGPFVWGREAVLAGADILEHAAGLNISVVKDPSKWKGWGEIELHSLDTRPWSDMDEGKAAEMIRLLVDRKVYLEPDLIGEGRGFQTKRAEYEAYDRALLADPRLAYIPAGTRQKWLNNYVEWDEESPEQREQLRKGFENFKRFIGMFARAGGKVMAGTDTSAPAPGGGGWAVAGIGMHYELDQLIEAGLTPMQAILAATRNVAEGFRVLDRVGTIEPGKFADLFVVNADPLQDVQNLRKIEWVIKDGKLINRTYTPWLENLFYGGGVEAREWVEALKEATARGLRTIAGLTDPTWSFGQPCPGIESISPTKVTEGDPTLTLTIRGVNFTKRSLVYANDRPLPTQLVSESELRATVDARSIAHAGTVALIVRNPGPHLSQPQWGNTSNRAFLLVDFRY